MARVITLFTFFFTVHLTAQVGLGTINPHTTAALEIASNSKGLLIPRLTTSERDLIVAPATGLIIYNTTTNGIEFFNGISWGAQMKQEMNAQMLLNTASAANNSVPLLQASNPALATIVSDFTTMPVTTAYKNITPVKGHLAFQNGTTVIGSNVITMTNTSGFLPGGYLTETTYNNLIYIEDGAKVVSVTATTVVMDKPAKASTTAPIRFNVTNPNIDYGGNFFCGNSDFINHFATRGSSGPKESVVKKIKFITDAREFQGSGYAILLTFVNAWGSSRVRVAINGQYVSSDMITMTGSPTALQITFPSSGAFYGPDEIEIEYGAGMYHNGLFIPSNANVWKPAPKPNFRVVGDSFVDNSYGFTYRAAEMLGGTVWNAAIGGTGYTTNINSSFGSVNRIASADYANFNCSIWYGTVNDGSGNANITSNALSAFQAERQKIGPGVPLIVFGCTINGNASRADRLLYESKIKEAIDQTNDPDIYWVPITGDPSGAWFTNPGNWSSYNSGDNIHPNNAGQKYLTAKAYAKIIEILAGIN
jgi:hypothetical protein